MMKNAESTLTEIENNDWGEPTFDSNLVIQCHKLRKKPLKDFSVEDLRLMIGQNISLDILVPIAIDRLTVNLLAEGNLYPGDLLNNVLTSDADFWKTHGSLQQKVIDLFNGKEHIFEDKTLRKIKRHFQEFSNRDV